MKRLSHADRVEKLREHLQHFEESPDFGDAEAVEVIRRHLRLRIREAEGLARVLEGERATRQRHVFQTEAA